MTYLTSLFAPHLDQLKQLAATEVSQLHLRNYSLCELTDCSVIIYCSFVLVALPSYQFASVAWWQKGRSNCPIAIS